mmetsp:Transcript_31038/g.67804  ORF Transcript_31038/g.67804 Transcript_31038/m.67804 type:complete len:545 (-) Transcript_31038:334-1968(-)|eukprot:CAMPEP_0118921320 /NCGR_PEP_ID=MMETSP1169-20130426/654_1 /TAXON_ID=36882 /ORGANISM="Pyramimonas obovata, Strain CCMP722" /LENGTH=544 /DNA_ID=CAMNT_0006862033 /DNA_START=348 /DNA_END=1982 /DNA_ORIENTATION=+
MTVAVGTVSLALHRRNASCRTSRSSDHTVVEAEVPLLEAPATKSRRGSSRRTSLIVTPKVQDQICSGIDTPGAIPVSPDARVSMRSSDLDLWDDEIPGYEASTSLPVERNVEDILRPSSIILERGDSDRLSISTLSGTFEVSLLDAVSSDGSSSLGSTSFIQDGRFDSGTEVEGQADEAPYDPLRANGVTMESLEKAPAETLELLLGEVSRQEAHRRSLECDTQAPSASVDESELDDLLEKVNLAEDSRMAAPLAPLQDADFKLLLKPGVRGRQHALRAYLTRTVYPVIIGALLAVGVALFASYGGFQTMSKSWIAFWSAGSPSVMLHKFISTMPVVCSVALQLSGLGTAEKIRREQSTGLLDPLPFVTMVSNCLVWSAYALLNSNITCFVPNFTGYLFGTYYVTNFARHTQVSMKGYYVGLGMVIAALCTAVLAFGMQAAYPIGLFGACSCVSMLASPLATIRTVIRTRSTASLTFPRTLASFIFALSWFTYGLVVAKDHFIYIPNALGLLATVVQLSMFAAFGFATERPATDALPSPRLKLA